jgi:membrane protein
LIISSLFGIIFKVLPDAKIKWKDVLTGAVATALLFMFGKFAISFYLGTRNIGNTYGAAGSIVIILLWVYYSAIILYFGAAFTKHYAQARGRRIYPTTMQYGPNISRKKNQGSLQEVAPAPSQ